MSLLQALILGLVQGVTEFIPISSSGHLVLVPWLLGWDKAPLAFDTMVAEWLIDQFFATHRRDYKKAHREAYAYLYEGGDTHETVNEC